MTANYLELLSGFYMREPPVWLPQNCIDRFYDESNRRVMNISGQLWKSWPVASAFARAKYGDDYVRGVAAEFLRQGATEENVWSAVRSGLSAWLAVVADSELSAVFRYENLLIGEIRRPYSGTLRLPLIEHAQLPVEFSLETFEFNVLALVGVFRLYIGAHAPDYMFSCARPQPKIQVLATYRRDGKIFARDVTFDVQRLSGHDLVNMEPIYDSSAEC
jgi:hypothetical protein